MDGVLGLAERLANDQYKAAIQPNTVDPRVRFTTPIQKAIRMLSGEGEMRDSGQDGNITVRITR